MPGASLFPAIPTAKIKASGPSQDILSTPSPVGFQDLLEFFWYVVLRNACSIQESSVSFLPLDIILIKNKKSPSSRKKKDYKRASSKTRCQGCSWGNRVFYNTCITFLESSLFFDLIWGNEVILSCFHSISSHVVGIDWRNWLKKFWHLEHIFLDLLSRYFIGQHLQAQYRSVLLPLLCYSFCQGSLTGIVFILWTVELQKYALHEHQKPGEGFDDISVNMTVNPTNKKKIFLQESSISCANNCTLL